MNILVNSLLEPTVIVSAFKSIPQVFEDGATYRGRLKALGRHVIKTFYSDMISPTCESNLNSDQYTRLIGENVTGLLEESTFLLAKELDGQVHHFI
jgi:hypothetical protein